VNKFADDTGLDGLALTSLNPGTVVPGSTMQLLGTSFVDADFGASVLRLRGTFGGQPVDLTLPLTFVDYQHMTIAWTGGHAMGLPGDGGTFSGMATVEVDSTIDAAKHVSTPLAVMLDVEASLTPRLDTVATGTIYVNDPIEVSGDGFLLGDGEGQTVAQVEGCFTPSGGSACTPVGPVEIPLVPETDFDRTHATFAFAPKIAGILPGQFSGMVTLVNHHAAHIDRSSAPQTAAYDLVPPVIFSVAPTAASLGQYVDILGGGFVGPTQDEPSALTTLELSGTFTLEGSTTATPISLTLIPEFVTGPHVRYVINEDDDLGHSLDLHTKAGSFQGTIRPVVQLGSDTVRGDPTTVSLGIAHVKQVVWLRFQPSYTESLRHFGVRALDAKLRDRVLEVAKRDYAGINIEFRTDPPTDFALFATVDISGPDVNGLGYFGYDNTPGKDVDNQRLYDQIGGLNATTQADGEPGYGGVFVESFFAFSMHPNGFATQVDGADPIFDAVFDPFRPDVGGRPVLAADVTSVAKLTSGAGCPAAASDRPGQIACAVWVLGSMIGTTMTHEVGHSLGLAAPYGDPNQYHDPGDQPNRLMDAGGARTLNERAELKGEGPGVFCSDEYDYLRKTLPKDEAPPVVNRPTCN
jgi:hypothetical protein